MRGLLDVNVLIALLDQGHVHHAPAMRWLGDHVEQGWASCPITQNGCIRIMSQPGYPNARAPHEIAERLREATLSPYHLFLPDDLSLLDREFFDWNHLLNPRQLTDAYLLALSIQYEGVFVTFDHPVPHKAVHGAAADRIVRI